MIPEEVREKANIRTGDRVDVQITPEGIVVVPIKKTYTEKARRIVRGKLSMKQLDDLYAKRSE